MARTTAQWLIKPEDAVLLFLDNQSGLFRLVSDVDEETLRSRVTALAKCARLCKTPVIATDSRPDGPNGRLVAAILADNPEAQYIPRTGQINAWDNPPWRDAIEKTGRRTLIMVGTLASVCLAQPALSAVTEGYTVYAVFDASGSSSSIAHDITLARLVQAGVRPVDTFAVHCELMQTWNRDDAGLFADVIGAYILPAYAALDASFQEANNQSQHQKT